MATVTEQNQGGSHPRHHCTYVPTALRRRSARTGQRTGTHHALREKEKELAMRAGGLGRGHRILPTPASDAADEVGRLYCPMPPWPHPWLGLQHHHSHHVMQSVLCGGQRNREKGTTAREKKRWGRWGPFIAGSIGGLRHHINQNHQKKDVLENYTPTNCLHLYTLIFYTCILLCTEKTC